jgi:hypothetical protein
MATFPNLKTGAVAQYPLSRSTRFSTQSVQFLDGSQQNFHLYPAGLRRWAIQLDGLDEQELDAVISFVEALGGAAFTFNDPVTGTDVVNCCIAEDQASAGMAAEMAGQSALVIEEVA